MMGANYRKPNQQEFQFNLVPKWMNITMQICKWFIYTMPFIITSIMFFSISELTTWDNWLLTCIYLLSLSNLINSIDK